MKPSRKNAYRWLALAALFLLIGITLPQLSSTNTKSGLSTAKNKLASKSLNPPQDPKKEGQTSGELNAKAEEFSPEIGTFPIPSVLPPKSRPAAINVTTVLSESREVEPNGTPATATPIGGTSVKVTGSINPNGDLDYYSFTAAAGDRIYAATQTSFSASANTDSILELFASDGTTVIEGDEDDGSFGSLSSSIANATIPTAGTYFLRVRHNSTTGQLRPYYLYFQQRTGSPTAETEPNDTFPGQALPASGWVSGSTSSATDVDFYSLNLNAGDTVFLSLDQDPERDGDANLQLGLGTFDNFILLVNDSGAGFAPYTAPDSEAYFMTVKDAGTYAILVSVPSGGVAAGTYTLSASVLPAVNRGINCTTYTSTDVPVAIPDVGAAVTSTITVPGNPRVEHLQVSIQLNHTFIQDLDVELIAPGGNIVGLFTDIGNSTTGGSSVMNMTLDDYAAIPPSFQVTAGMIYQPELNYRLDWFKGQPAGGAWTLRLRDDFTGDTGTLTGWSIRICEPPTAPSCGAGFQTQTVFSTDFESGAAGFTHTGTQDEWELGLPATAATTTTNPVAAFTTANSGTNAWKTDLDNTYNASSNQDLLSPNINLAGLSGPVRLTWAQKFQMDTATNDHAWVDVRIVGNPASAKRVWEWDGAAMTNAVGSPVVNVGEAAGWGLYNADISSFAGQNIELVFHLDSGTGATNFAGLAIDDVSVTACMLIPCTITCPANITQANTTNQCGAIVTYPAPTADAACGTVTCSPPSGSFFNVGTTTVTCTSTAGPSCNFTVTVNDTQPPTITCPANQTATSPSGTPIVVNYPAPTVTDNCSTSCASRPAGLKCTPGTTICTPPSGSTFSVGTTTVNCTACDCAGNSATCSFTVTVASCVLTCPANITQSNDPNQCGAVVNYTPNASAGCTVTCTPPSGSFFPVGTTTVNCQNTGGTPNCSFTVTVTDDQPPSITCPANITRANDPNQCGATVTYPAPTVTDNCPGTFTATCTPPSGSFFPVGTTTVNCSVNGGSSRPTEGCMMQTITQSSSQTIEALNSVSCNNGVGHTDNSYFRAFTLSTFGINTAFNITSVDIGIEDAISGSKASGGGTKGSTPPASGGTKGGQAGAPKKSISKKVPGAARPAGGGQPLTVNLYTSSSAFPTGFPGSLTLIGTASVTVADQSGTILNVPITATAPAGSQLVVEVFTPDGETAGNLFFIGSNTAAQTGPSYLRAADCGVTTPTDTAAIGFPDMHIVLNVNGCPQSSGGGSTCSFTVTVNDTQPPTITCPANVTALAPICAGTTAVVNYPAPTASDNCPGVTTACVPPAGSTFPIGVTTVTCTATDASGNTATCSFTVTTFNACIQDDNNPNIVLLWNTQTGAYRFCCNGTTYTGTGLVQNKGNSHTINHMATDRRVNGVLDCATSKGQGGLQSNAGTLICSINDRDIRNNTCNCGSAPPPTQ